MNASIKSSESNLDVVDMSPSIFAWIDIKNMGNEPTYAWLRLGNHEDDDEHIEWQRQGLVLKPNEEIAFQFKIPRQVQWNYDIKRMYVTGYPDPAIDTNYGTLRGAPPHFTTSWGSNYDADDLRIMNQIIIKVGEPLTNDTPMRLRFCNPRHTYWNATPILLRESEYYPSRTALSVVDNDNFYPWIDQFGQRLYEDWHGRVTTHHDFQAQKQAEFDWLSSRSGPNNWSQYGGYIPGGQHVVTGHFHTQKINGKWWFIDPEGYPFFSVGITGMGNDGGTTPNELFGIDRSSWQERCSSSNIPSNLSDHCGPDDRFDYFSEALCYKYGPCEPDKPASYNGQLHFAKYASMLQVRMKKWGVNTMGSWSVDELITQPILAEFATQISGITTGQRNTYTLFFNLGAKTDISTYGSKLVSELTTEFENTIRDTIVNINALLSNNVQDNMTINTDPYCLGVFTGNEIPGGTENDWTKYYEAAYAAIRNVLPNKLWLCNRFGNYPGTGTVSDLAFEYCDVVTYNWYHNEVNEYSPAFPHLPHMQYNQRQSHTPHDKPMMVGEFSIGTFDSANVASAARHATTDEQRGRIAVHYWKTAIKTSNIIGAHWFRMTDQTLLGRSDGENYQNGFTTYLDYPYYDFVNNVRAFTHSMYDEYFAPT
jgi:hypothetical protein